MNSVKPELEALVNEALAAVPRHPEISAEEARNIARLTLLRCQIARRPVDFDALRELRLSPNDRQANTASPKILTVARVPTEACKIFEAEWKDLATDAAREAWTLLGATGDVDAGIEAMCFRLGAGPINAGFDANGNHLVWEKIIREDLAEADVLLVMDEGGFAADLKTWVYALTFAKKHLKIVFKYRNGRLHVHDKDEFMEHAADPPAFWLKETRQDHIFLFFASPDICLGSELGEEAVLRYKFPGAAPAQA